MKRIISVSAYGRINTILWEIYNYHKFNVDIEELSYSHGVVKQKCTLMVEGSKADIHMYISYLKHQGFAIK